MAENTFNWALRDFGSMHKILLGRFPSKKELGFSELYQAISVPPTWQYHAGKKILDEYNRQEFLQESIAPNMYKFRQNIYGSDGAIDRLTLNVYPNADMLRKLDDIIISDRGAVASFYTAAKTLKQWAETHEPLIVWMHKADAKTKQIFIDRVTAAAKEYVRREDADSIHVGKSIVPGVQLVEDPDTKTILDLFKKIHRFPNVEKAAKSWTDIKYPTPSLNARQFWILKNFMDYFENLHRFRQQTRAELMRLASFQIMSKPTAEGTPEKVQYIIPQKGREKEVALKISNLGIKAQAHHSKYFNQTVFVQENQK